MHFSMRFKVPRQKTSLEGNVENIEGGFIGVSIMVTDSILAKFNKYTLILHTDNGRLKDSTTIEP